MNNLQDKISALSALMANGTLTPDEFTKIVALLGGGNAQATTKAKTPMEQKYEDYIYNHIAYAFKSPSSVKAPPLTQSMIKEGNLSILNGLKYIPTNVRYIETYIDAPNSYGTMLRKDICIVVDNDFNPLYTLENVPKILTGAKSEYWSKMGNIR